MAQGHSKGNPDKTSEISYLEELEMREQATQDAMRLWQDNAVNYRTAIIEYKFLARARREAGVCPINTLPKYVLKEYPEIEFFLRCIDEVSAREYLENLTLPELNTVVNRITDMIEINHAYRGVNARVKEFRYWIKHFGRKGYCYSLGVSTKRHRCFSPYPMSRPIGNP